ncbi:MAG: RND family transporter, partial [Nitrospinota bacterium]
NDQHSTILQINLAVDQKFDQLYRKRNGLLNKKNDGVLAPEEARELLETEEKYTLEKERVNKERHDLINEIRNVMDKHRAGATLFLGGVPMISDDMITFIKKDIKVFGVGIVLFLIFILIVIFSRVRWVVVTMLCCACSAVTMAGLVSLVGWQVTVISSNFISVQLVITMSITIHLIVRYNELAEKFPGSTHRDIVYGTVASMIKPCIFTTLTTIAGFGSLLFCDILPVINFGWMMVIGLIVSLLVTFLLFPAVLLLLKSTAPVPSKGIGYLLTSFFARCTKERTFAVFTLTLFVLIFTSYGISKLAVENSFIDYFRSSTEIYKGMKMIDEKFGGTTPLDIVLDFETSQDEGKPVAQEQDDLDVFDDFNEFEDTGNEEMYWFTPDKLELIRKTHDYLNKQKEIGKVLSLQTMMEVITKLNGGKEMDHLGLTLLLNELPSEIKEKVVYPYMSVEKNQARLTVRIKDSLKSLKRDELLKRVKSDLAGDLTLEPEQIHLAGVMVLYNNMLQSLFHSQIETIGFTILALMIMFMLLFRSFIISLIAIFPNLLSSMSVLGVMGALDIPLDMMTITIVAISIGIAVDDTIHYIHRFRREFENERNYVSTVFKCHRSIGNAMYYTSVTIVIGFAILVFSNFIPSLLFGLLTGLAMVMALISSLTLLPALIVIIKPFGPATAQ